MDAIFAGDLHKLLQKQAGFCTTIYMPTHVVGPHAPDDAVRLRNLVSTAKHKLIEQPIVKNMPAANADVQRDVQFSTAVAGFGQLLRGGQYTGSLSLDDIIEDAQASTGSDADGYRAEFVQLVRKARHARGM